MPSASCNNTVYDNYCNLPFRYFKPVPAITDGNGIIVDTNSHITRMPNVSAYPAYQGRTYEYNLHGSAIPAVDRTTSSRTRS